jgi:hypothetical protein
MRLGSSSLQRTVVAPVCGSGRQKGKRNEARGIFPTKSPSDGRDGNGKTAWLCPGLVLSQPRRSLGIPQGCRRKSTGKKTEEQNPKERTRRDSLRPEFLIGGNRVVAADIAKNVCSTKTWRAANESGPPSLSPREKI